MQVNMSKYSELYIIALKLLKVWCENVCPLVGVVKHPVVCVVMLAQSEVGKHQRAFRGCEQQDSHEFLTILMDWLHLDLQFSIKPPHKVNDWKLNHNK